MIKDKIPKHLWGGSWRRVVRCSGCGKRLNRKTAHYGMGRWWCKTTTSCDKHKAFKRRLMFWRKV